MVKTAAQIAYLTLKKIAVAGAPQQPLKQMNTMPGFGGTPGAAPGMSPEDRSKAMSDLGIKSKIPQGFDVAKDRVRDSYDLSNPVDQHLLGEKAQDANVDLPGSWKSPAVAPAPAAPAPTPAPKTPVAVPAAFVPKQTSFNTSNWADREYLGLSDSDPRGLQYDYDSRTAPKRPAYGTPEWRAGLTPVGYRRPQQ